ncbi:MAG: hypothetical protein QOJ85_3866 [Solirubrobacteraceae bacterium]|jgi:hypothetical protein|nr:hypothetical protein [Solirubrobacteraceae bacterium]MEA2240674.1 hypothetical protein [Solirubrobacteraceae bacterium]
MRVLLVVSVSFAVCVAAVTPAAVPAQTPSGDPSGSARRQLVSIVQEVTRATRAQYNSRDTGGRTLDTIKIVERGGGGYVSAFHSPDGAGSFSVRFASSTNLLTWSSGTGSIADASQATLARRPNGSFLAAYEQRSAGGRSHLQFGQYGGISALLAGNASSVSPVSRSLSTWNEGTPSLHSVTDVSATVGFHYLATDVTPAVDRNASGLLNGFPGSAPTWGSITVDARVNNAIQALEPTVHHIGDRDRVMFQGYGFRLVEAQTRRDDWSSWRVYLYDETADARGDTLHAMTKLNVRTHRASSSFGNPTATVVTDPIGLRAVVVTLFLFSEGAAAGEAGELIYYRRY